jgi:hypothetical protein
MMPAGEGRTSRPAAAGAASIWRVESTSHQASALGLPQTQNGSREVNQKRVIQECILASI